MRRASGSRAAMTFLISRTRGFPEEFVKAETRICGRDGQGRTLRDNDGYPIMECMCGNVMPGRFDPSQRFFTAAGASGPTAR